MAAATPHSRIVVRMRSTELIPHYWLLLAKGDLSRRLFGSTLRMIAAVPLPDMFTLDGFTVKGKLRMGIPR